MDVIAWLEFELTYFKAIVQNFSHYVVESPPYSVESVYVLKIVIAVVVINKNNNNTTITGKTPGHLWPWRNYLV